MARHELPVVGISPTVLAALLLLLATGCGGSSQSETSEPSAARGQAGGGQDTTGAGGEPSSGDRISKGAGDASKYRDSRIEILGRGMLYRQGDGSAPPWTSVEVINVFGFESDPGEGSKVTVIPVQVEGDPFELEILSTKQRVDTTPGWWEVELSPVTDDRYLTMDAPANMRPEFLGTVAVLYPAVDGARLVEVSSIAKEDLPALTPRAVVAFAVDSTGDGRPDGLETSFCCGNDKKPASGGSCDYTCSRTFLRRDGKWVQVASSEPQ